jgi:hypothetical protein
MSDIRSNLLKAISVSKPDTNSDIRTLPDTKPVKESEASYCDPKGSREDLTFLSKISGMRFYISRSINQHNLNGELVLFQFGDAIVRYVDLVIKPIGGSSLFLITLAFYIICSQSSYILFLAPLLSFPPPGGIVDP